MLFGWKLAIVYNVISNPYNAEKPPILATSPEGMKMRKKSFIVLLSAAVLVLVGCGASEPEMADSIDDMVGTWRRIRVGSDSAATDFCKFSNSGTYICNFSLEEINQNEGWKGNFWFEGSQYFDQTTGAPEGSPSLCTEVGIYEIQLLGNGNLKYVLVKDACRDRASSAAGRGVEEDLVEWEPVP